jgi:hypothetical protein
MIESGPAKVIGQVLLQRTEGGEEGADQGEKHEAGHHQAADYRRLVLSKAKESPISGSI